MQLIQVTWDMTDNETRKREINGLLEASEATGCSNLLIITADHQEAIELKTGNTIQAIPAWHWLLNK